MMLDIGCGEKKRGYIRLDLRKTSSVDVVADARALPFRDEAFDYVYSSHLIEHISHREVNNVLAEWVRVLKKKVRLLKFVVPTFVRGRFYSF
jgi:predicted SAM-dependent methyltransferase